MVYLNFTAAAAPAIVFTSLQEGRGGVVVFHMRRMTMSEKRLYRRLR